MSQHGVKGLPRPPYDTNLTSFAHQRRPSPHSKPPGHMLPEYSTHMKNAGLEQKSPYKRPQLANRQQRPLLIGYFYPLRRHWDSQPRSKGGPYALAAIRDIHQPAILETAIVCERYDGLATRKHTRNRTPPPHNQVSGRYQRNKNSCPPPPPPPPRDARGGGGGGPQKRARVVPSGVCF
jgi:hypothetical protein